MRDNKSIFIHAYISS